MYPFFCFYHIIYFCNVFFIFFRVPLDTDLLEEFPDIKMKLVKKLECIAKEKFTILRSLV